MIRIFGSVPEGRTRIRPRAAEAGVGLCHRDGELRIDLPLVPVADGRVYHHLRQQLEFGRLRSPSVAPVGAQRSDQLDGGQDPVPGGRQRHGR